MLWEEIDREPEGEPVVIVKSTNTLVLKPASIVKSSCVSYHACIGFTNSNQVFERSQRSQQPLCFLGTHCIHNPTNKQFKIGLWS